MKKRISRRSFLARTSKTTIGLGVLGLGLNPAREPWPISPDAVDDDAFWRTVRAQFPLTKERAYLNTGGLGPASYPVLDEVHRNMMERQFFSEHGHNLIAGARDVVADFVGADASEIAFTRNATEGNATVASGFDLRAGDEVIFESHAHPGGSVPWLNRQKNDGVKVRMFEPDHTSPEENLNRIEAQITDRTRVIQVSHVTAPTGIHMPVKAIAKLAHDRGIWFHIDGAQSAGMIPVDLHDIGCDSYATSCHKWMLAPHGTGFIYVKQDRLDAITPTDVGAYSGPYTLPDQFSYDATAVRYECGTRDVPSILGIADAIKFLQEIGMDRVVDRGHSLAKYLNARLSEIPGVTVLSPKVDSLAAAMTTFKTDRVSYTDLNSMLSEDFQLRCRVVSERGLNAIRVSTHIFNFPEECDRVVEGTMAALA